jgi:hypothetical protein
LIIDEEDITTDSSSSLEDGDNDLDESFNASRDEDDLKDHIMDE